MSEFSDVTKASLAALLASAGVDDEDTVDYVVGLAEAGEWEALPEFLEGAGVDDEDVANDVAARLRTVAESADAGDDDDLALLTAPVTLGASTRSFEAEERARLDNEEAWGKPKVSYNEATDGAAAATSKRAERKAARDVERARAAFDDQMAASDHGGGGVAAMTVPERDGAGSGSRDIHVTDFDVYFGGSCLLRSADLHLAYQRRYGLVGPNGVGKTTLLRHMAAFDLPKFPRHLRVLHVRQEVAPGAEGVRVVDAVLGADAELAALGARERELSASLESLEPAAAVAAHAELASIAQQLESLDASTAHARASAILHGLGFSEEKQVAPLSSLSGGWRVRTALAGALFVSPDLLLLDEPTNHLDLEACIWLEHYLVHTFKHTLVLVSHDRSFLNAVCTDCVVFKDQRLVPFRGDYDAYVKARDEAAARARREYDAYVDQRAHIQEFIDKFRYNAKRASIVQSRIKTVEKMDAEAPDEPKDAKPWTFAIPAAEPLSRPMLQAETCAFGYGDGPSLFENVDFDVDDKSRVAIVGPNGSGKSTLLKLLLGEIKPRSGEVHRKQQLKVEFFTQHHADQLDLNLSPIENVLRRFKSASEAEVRGHLGQFMIDGDLQLKPCALMSGGQKSRVAFALLAFARPHVVVLDEPTNHLDMDAIDALAGALKSFRGGVLVVSHDQHFLAAVCDALWVVGKGKVRRFDGDFDAYKKKTLKDKGAT